MSYKIFAYLYFINGKIFAYLYLMEYKYVYMNKI